MKRKSIGTNYSMCFQPIFIIGTYNIDNSPDFAPITWVSLMSEIYLSYAGLLSLDDLAELLKVMLSDDLNEFQYVVENGKWNALLK